MKVYKHTDGVDRSVELPLGSMMVNIGGQEHGKVTIGTDGTYAGEVEAARDMDLRHLYMATIGIDGIVRGYTVTEGDDFTATLAGGSMYYNEGKLRRDGEVVRDYTAEKDTYVDITALGEVTYTEVDNDAAAPDLADGSTRLARVNTDDIEVTSVYNFPVDYVNLDVNSKVDLVSVGAPDGVASLNAEGLVPTSQLPSYVDDVLSFDTTTDFPDTGESSKIYIAKDTNITYRWNGDDDYTEISSSLALGETESTAYRGDYGKVAYDHSQEDHTMIKLVDTDINNVAEGQILVWNAESAKWINTEGTGEKTSIADVLTDQLGDFVYSGFGFNEGADAGDLKGVLESGLLYYEGIRASYTQADTELEFEASKDTYLDVDTDGTLTLVAVDNDADEPAVTDHSMRLLKVVTDADGITSYGTVTVTGSVIDRIANGGDTGPTIVTAIAEDAQTEFLIDNDTTRPLVVELEGFPLVEGDAEEEYVRAADKITLNTGADAGEQIHITAY